MSRAVFSPAEVAYLTEGRRLARIATADGDGRLQVTPVGMWRLDPPSSVVEVTGRDFAATRKFRNVTVSPRAALVVDDVAPGEEWRPRAVMIEGPAQAVDDDEGGPLIRIMPDRIVSWGL